MQYRHVTTVTATVTILYVKKICRLVSVKLTGDGAGVSGTKAVTSVSLAEASCSLW